MYNNAFCSNSNAFSLIICKVHTRRENTGSWNSGPEKATSGHLFYTTPNELKTSWRFFMEYIRIIGTNNHQRGPTRWAKPAWARQGAQARPGGLCPPRPTFSAILLVYKSFWPRKNKERTFGMERRLLEAKLGQEHFCPPVEWFRWGELPSRRGKSSSSSSPTTLPSWGGQSPSTSSPAPSHLKP